MNLTSPSARLLYAWYLGFHARIGFSISWTRTSSLDDRNGFGQTPRHQAQEFAVLLPKVVQGLLEISATLCHQSIESSAAFWLCSRVDRTALATTHSPSLPTNHSNQLFLVTIALHPALVCRAPKLLIEMQCLLLMASLSLLVLSRHHLLRQSPISFGFAVYIRYQAVTTATFALFILLTRGKPPKYHLLVAISGAIANSMWYDRSHHKRQISRPPHPNIRQPSLGDQPLFAVELSGNSTGAGLSLGCPKLNGENCTHTDLLVTYRRGLELHSCALRDPS